MKKHLQDYLQKFQRITITIVAVSIIIIVLSELTEIDNLKILVVPWFLCGSFYAVVFTFHYFIGIKKS